MRGPQAYFADDLKNWNSTTQRGTVWVAARPECATWHETLQHRLRLALKVFTGKADVLLWYQQ